MPEGDRVDCPHADRCPGCPLLALGGAERRAAKEARLAAALEPYPGLTSVRPGPLVEIPPVTGYRQRVKLAVEGAAIGLFAAGTHEVVDNPDCRVLPAVARDLLDDLRRRSLGRLGLSAVDLRVVGDRLLVVLVIERGREVGRFEDVARALVAERPEVAGVALSERDAGSPRLLGGPPRVVAGVGALERRVHPSGPVDLVAPGGFAQVHAGVERAVHEAIARAVEPRPGRVVIEAFAGAGALSLELARRGARVLSVESFEPAVRLAREAARAESLPLEATAGDAARFLRDAAARGERPHALVLNPPRRGLSPGLRADAAALSPRRIAYLSCEPRTLARDLADLAVKGYRPGSLLPFDMIPLTAEVETLAVLARDELPPPELLHEDEALLAVVKPPHEPTTPQGEHQGSLLARVRALPGASAAVPVHRLDVGTSGVCLFAREPGAVAVLARALAEGEKEYVALLRGVTRDRGVVSRPLLEQGRTVAARTRYVRRQVVAGHSLVSVLPDQGRRHQIRRHVASIGHPVVGDQRHGHPPTNAHFEARVFLDRPFLHCARIELPLPGRALSLEAALAPDLAVVLGALRGARGPGALPE